MIITQFYKILKFKWFSLINLITFTGGDDSGEIY